MRHVSFASQTFPHGNCLLRISRKLSKPILAAEQLKPNRRKLVPKRGLK